MRRLAILSALIGIMALAACGPQAGDTTPTIAANPTPDATANAGTTNDTADSNLPNQETSLTASMSGTAITEGEAGQFNALGRWACQPPTTVDTENEDTTTAAGANVTDIPGSMQITGVDEQNRTISINLPFEAEPGTYDVDPLSGIGAYSVIIALSPSDPNQIYQSASGTITIESLPEGLGSRAAGSFDVLARNSTGEGEIEVNGEFDFIADDTSLLCNRPDRDQ